MGNVPRPLFVMSDAHLGAGDPDAEATKSRRLAAFWRTVGQRGGDLVILGDLFDFWFEYRNAIPRFHFDQLMALRDLVRGGARVYYVAGNHDFWAGPFLRDEIGVAYCEDELLLEYGGRRIRFAHGDGWPPGERGYRLMKSVFRNRAAIALFRLLSPDLGFPLARWLSGRSRGSHHLPPRTLEIYAGLARARLAADCDVLFIGHLHECRHYVWPEGEWIITGDWMTHFSYAEVCADGPRLYRWQDDGPPVVVAAEASKSASATAARNS